MVGADAVASVVEHRRAGRRCDLAGLLVGELAGRIVGRDIGEPETLHQPAGGDADDVGGWESFPAASGDDVDHSELRMEALQTFAVEEPARLDGLVQRREHEIGLCEQPINQVPGAGRFEVERQAALAGVVEQMSEAALEIRAVVQVRPADTQRVA